MTSIKNYLIVIVTLLINVSTINCDDLQDLLSNCHMRDPKFDECLRQAFNKLNPIFKYGIPEYNIAPFDPHKQSYIEQNRGDKGGLAGFKLQLKDVSENGWTQSHITSLKMDWKNNAMIYSQQFPEKSLDGLYSFEAKVLGQPINTSGNWSMTLYDYSQTTIVKRIGGPGGRLKVRVEIDKIGDLKMHISDLLGGRKVMENVADFFLNNAWQPGFPFIKPLINDLVSIAFTDIFNESFRYFPIDKYIKY